MQHDSQTYDFLDALYPAGLPDGCSLPIFKLRRDTGAKMSQFYLDLRDAVASVEVDRANWECYFGCCCQPEWRAAANGGERGGNDTAAAMPGVWIDVDVAGPGHKGDRLFEGDEEALAFLGCTGLEPSAVVMTGGGVQAWWLFDEVATFGDAEGRARHARLAASWVATLRCHAEARGRRLDNVGDLARVLRLPGTYNLKTGSPRPVSIASLKPNVRYSPSALDEVLEVRVAERKPRERPEGEQAGAVREDTIALVEQLLPALGVGRATDYDEWVKVGHALKGEGEALRPYWHEFSRRAGAAYDEAEADRKWDSFKPTEIGLGSIVHMARQDRPQRSQESRAVGSAWQLNEVIAPATINVPAATTPSAGTLRTAPAENPPAAGAVSAAPNEPDPLSSKRLSNVIDKTETDAEGKKIDYVHYRPMPQVLDMLHRATGGWPKRVGTALFVVEGEGDVTRLDRSPVKFLTKTEQMFAWVMGGADVRWHSGDCRKATTGEKTIAPTKNEFFEYCKLNIAPAYTSIEVLPHEPPVEDVYYIPTKLPDVRHDADHLTGSPLWELVSRFNPATEDDRQLLLAALLTPGWGGPCGLRPAFVACSDFGRGSGKTSTMEAIADVWGGCIGVGAAEDWDTVRKRLLGDESATTRVILIDNLKGKLNSGDIESAITSRKLDGWKPYHGQASRPNRLTWFITANSPSLSKDLAERSILIKIGAQKHGEDFVSWSKRHIERYRGEIIAELFEILRRPDGEKIERKNRDRWQAWQDAVLSKLQDANRLARLCIDRRPDVDADAEDAEDLHQHLVNLMKQGTDPYKGGYPNYEGERILISTDAAYEHLREQGFLGDMSRRGFQTWIKGQVGQGTLADYKYARFDFGRGILWTGREWDGNKRIEHIERRAQHQH